MTRKLMGFQPCAESFFGVGFTPLMKMSTFQENHQQMAFCAIAAIAKKGMVTFCFSTFWAPEIWQAQKQKIPEL